MNAIRVTTHPRRGLRAAAIFLTAAACAFVLVGPAAAQVSNDWTQFQGGPTHPGEAADAAAPPYASEWTAAVPLAGPNHHSGLSALVVAGSQAVAVGPELVLGFDITSGAATFSVARDFGPPVPAAVAELDGRRVVAFTEGSAGSAPGASASPSSPAPTAPGVSPTPASGPVDAHLAAFDLRTRKPLWNPIELDDVSRTGVTVVEGIAYVGTDAGTVYAVDLARGRIVWKVGLGGGLFSPLAADGGLVVAGVAGDARTPPSVVALSGTDGTQSWKFEPPSAGVVSGIAIADARVFAGFSDTTVRAIDLRGGTEVWSSRLNAPVYPQAGPAISQGSLYALDVNAQLYRIDASDGTRIWDFALNAITPRSWPVVTGSDVLVSTDEGRFVAIAVDGGHLVWDGGPGGDPLRWLLPTPDRILGVRGGARAGIEAFASDPSAPLLDVVSPTVADPGVLVKNFAIAAVPIVVIVLLLGSALGRRMGPAFIIVDEDDAPAGAADDEDER